MNDVCCMNWKCLNEFPTVKREVAILMETEQLNKSCCDLFEKKFPPLISYSNTISNMQGPSLTSALYLSTPPFLVSFPITYSMIGTGLCPWLYSEPHLCSYMGVEFEMAPYDIRTTPSNLDQHAGMVVQEIVTKCMILIRSQVDVIC